MSAIKGAPGARPAHGPSTSTNLRLLQADILREQLRTRGKIPLALTREERAEWAARGMTLRQRDAAAAFLVRSAEAEYRVLPDARFVRTGSDAVVHLVAELAEGER